MPKKRKFKCEENLRKKYDATKFLFAEKKCFTQAHVCCRLDTNRKHFRNPKNGTIQLEKGSSYCTYNEDNNQILII